MSAFISEALSSWNWELGEHRSGTALTWMQKEASEEYVDVCSSPATILMTLLSFNHLVSRDRSYLIPHPDPTTATKLYTGDSLRDFLLPLFPK